MIRYEYEEYEGETNQSIEDQKMPIVRNADMHPTVSNQHPFVPTDSLFPEADWLSSDASVGRQIDDYAQLLDIEGVFDELQPANNADHSHHFNDSLYDSHYSSFYSNATVDEEQINHENNMNGISFEYYQQSQHAHHSSNRHDMQPLRSRDLNVPTQRSLSSRQEKKKIKKPNKPPSQRRPIDEYPTKNGFKKPLFSYSCLIGLAMRNCETGELTVAEIYRFLCEHFPFFREAPSGWKNSVRHNLSLNKCFQKVEITVPDAQGRRSCLWRINPAKLDRMASEISKWKERCSPTIALAMDNPNDLDDIINGKKGMPPADDLYIGVSGRDDENEVGQGRSKERVIYISRMQDLNKFESQRPRTIETRPAQYHSVPGHSKYVVRQPLRCIKQEENYYENENENIQPTHSLPSTSHFQVPSSSHYKLHSSSVHERAKQNLESLLERKKHATVHPRDDSSSASVDPEDRENCPPPVQRVNEQKTPLHPNRPDFQSEAPAASSSTFANSVRPLKPLAIRIQRPHQLNASETYSVIRHASQLPQ